MGIFFKNKQSDYTMQEISHYSYKFNYEMSRLLREIIDPNLIPVENTTEKVHISIEKESKRYLFRNQ